MRQSKKKNVNKPLAEAASKGTAASGSTRTRTTTTSSDVTPLGDALRQAMMVDAGLLAGTLEGLKELAEGHSQKVSRKKD